MVLQLVAGYAASVASVPISIVSYGVASEVVEKGSLPEIDNLLFSVVLLGSVVMPAASLILLVFLVPVYILLRSFGHVSMTSMLVVGVCPPAYILLLIAMKDKFRIEIFWISTVISIFAVLAFYLGTKLVGGNDPKTI